MTSRKEELKEFQEAKKNDPALTYDEWSHAKMGNPEPDQDIHIEGVGTIKVYGKWPVKKMVEKLLEYEFITGDPTGKK